MVDKAKAEFVTSSGIPIKEVYTSADLPQDVRLKMELPGEEPYTRGIYPNMYRGKLWTVRQFSGFGIPEETHDRFKHEYELGATGFSIAFDSVTESGWDSDYARAEADVGAGGVPVDSLKDFRAMFEGLPIDRVSTAVIATPWTACPLSAMYFATAEDRGIDLRKLDGTTQNDLVLFTSCCNLIDIIPPRYLIRLCVDLIEWCAINMPKWHPVSFASYNYRENGITAYQELGMLLANAAGYIDEELGRNRLEIDQFAPTLSCHMAAHNDILEEVAKFRAARRLWYRLMKENYGAKDPRSLKFRFHVQTSGSTHVYQQPLNNLIRIAYQVLAAALGGGQSLHANSYDEAICLPTEQSILLSIRTQQIAQYESGITNVADPLGGSYYVEWLTSELEKRAWEYFEEIESMGGIVPALESGWIHKEYNKAMMEHERKVATGETKVVGVNCFQLEEEPYDVPIFRPNPMAAQVQKAKLEELRRERSSLAVERSLDELRRATESGENVMPTVFNAVKSYATLGEICNVWRKVYGVWKVPLTV